MNQVIPILERVAPNLKSTCEYIGRCLSHQEGERVVFKMYDIHTWEQIQVANQHLAHPRISEVLLSSDMNMKAETTRNEASQQSTSHQNLVLSCIEE
jgi:hypothetical protein